MNTNGKIPLLDLVTPHQELEDELVSVFKNALKTAAFVGGPMVEVFEREFAEFCETQHCVGVGSGTDAVRLALLAAGIRPGDTVVTVPNTFIATTEAISQVGGRPDFVDIDERAYTMDPEKLRCYLETECTRDMQTERVVSRRTGSPVTAVIPVHLYGQMADMDPILDLATRYNLIVIEDACQAHGAEYLSRTKGRWRKAGSMGRAAAFSFYPGKNLGACGEAGAITTDDEQLARRCQMLRDHGQSRKYFHDIEGYNGRLDAIQAGILRAKLPYLANWNTKRRENARRYDELLAPAAGALTLPYVPGWSRPVHHLYVVGLADRDRLRADLARDGIDTGIHYPVPLHLLKAYEALGFRRGDFPVAERTASQVLSLPMFPELRAEQQRVVTDAVLSRMARPVAFSTLRTTPRESGPDLSSHADGRGIERALIDYYRCPEEFAKMSLAGELCHDPGYFRFAGDTCYGRSSCGLRSRVPNNGLYNTLPAVTMKEGVLRLPFDPSEVIDNLRLERYAAHSQGPAGMRHASWQRHYYSLRRFIPAPLRRRLQRTYFRDWKTLAFPRWPVDVTVEQILERLASLCLRSQGIERLPFIWFWPDGAPSCAIVTHDVESSTGRDRCSWLMDVDDSYGIKASFQIVPEQRYSVSHAFLNSIRDRGCEINVHDLNHDGRLFSGREEFLRRAQRINGYLREFGARGFRSGGLYRHPDWYEALEIAYDMSIPNSGHLEIQRGGCCTVMPYFIGDILELPVTTTQDYSLLHIMKDSSNDVWKNQIQSVIGRHGLLSFIVHPDYLGVDHARQAYRVLLAELSRLREAERCWVTLPGEVDRWWRQRSRMTLLQDGSRWRIEGPGKERARIAYAELDGDDLVCTVEPPPLNRRGTPGW